jgi:hypothetical protein
VLFVPFYKNWMFDGLASFNVDEANGWLKGRVYFYDERSVRLRESRCKIRRLDDLDLSPFFIKLDVQGYEYKALKGGEETLRKHQPVLLIETPNQKTREFLTGLGYTPYAYEAGRFKSSEYGSLNTFFMTPKRAGLVRAYIS